MERLQQIYEDAGRPNSATFKAAALLDGVIRSKRDAEEFVKNQSIRQVFKAPPRSKGKVVSTSEGQKWQIDLIDHTKMVRSSNHNYRFVLVVIDTFSRELWAETQQDNTPSETLASFNNIEARAGGLPSEVDSDMGNECTGPFNAYLDSKNVAHLTRDPRQSNALAVIDSAIRSINIIMSRNMTARRTGSWASVLQKSVASDNNKPHESLMDTKP